MIYSSMVVMVADVGFPLLNIALLVTAVFVGVLNFQDTMGDSVFCQGVPDSLLDLIWVLADLQVHGGTVFVTVNAPDVNVVHICDPGRLHNNPAYVGNGDPFGCSFQKKL